MGYVITLHGVLCHDKLARGIQREDQSDTNQGTVAIISS